MSRWNDRSSKHQRGEFKAFSPILLETIHMTQHIDVRFDDLFAPVSFGGGGSSGGVENAGTWQNAAQCGLDIIEGAQQGAWAGAGVGAAAGSVLPDPATTAGGAAIGAGIGAGAGGILAGVASDSCNALL